MCYGAGVSTDESQFTEKQRAVIDEIARDFTEWARNIVVGAVEAGLWMVHAQEQADQWAVRTNEAPLDARLRLLALISNNFVAVTDEVADVTFACSVEPLEQEPTLFSFNVRANVSYRRPVERVFVTFTVNAADAVLDVDDPEHAPCLKCPVPGCTWVWELREGFKPDEAAGRELWRSHYASEHPPVRDPDEVESRSIFAGRRKPPLGWLTEDDWVALPEDERARYEASDESTMWYRPRGVAPS